MGANRYFSKEKTFLTGAQRERERERGQLVEVGTKRSLMKVALLPPNELNSVISKKSPNVYKSCPKMISLKN